GGGLGGEGGARLETLQGLEQARAENAPVEAPTLLPVAAGLAALPALRVSAADAGRLARGQAVLLRGRDAPLMEGWVSVSTHGALVALAQVERGELRPRRSFNLPRGERGKTRGKSKESSTYGYASGRARGLKARNFRWRPRWFCDIARLARVRAAFRSHAPESALAYWN